MWFRILWQNDCICLHAYVSIKCSSCRWRRLHCIHRICRQVTGRQQPQGNRGGCGRRLLPQRTWAGRQASGRVRSPCCELAAGVALGPCLGRHQLWAATTSSVAPGHMQLTATPHLRGMCAPSISSPTSTCFPASCCTGVSPAANASSFMSWAMWNPPGKHSII